MAMITVIWRLPGEALEAAWEVIRSVVPDKRHNERCVNPRAIHHHPDVQIVFAGADVEARA